MCDATPPAHLSLAAHIQAAPEARRFLETHACLAHHSRVLSEAKLLATELITNAVAHGSPPITLRLSCDGTPGMVIAVSDGSSQAPIRRDVPPEAVTGRGVMLVDLLSDAWGVEVDEVGKMVWFRLSA